MKKNRLRDDEEDIEEEEYEEQRPGKTSRAQKESDRSDLKVLSMIYYILGILQCISLALVLLVCVIIGIVMMAGISSAGGGNAAWVGLVPIGIGIFFAVVMGVIVYLVFLTSRSYHQKTGWTLCFVRACLSLPSVPVGTLLGIYAIMVLNRPSVKKMFR